MEAEQVAKESMEAVGEPMTGVTPYTMVDGAFAVCTQIRLPRLGCFRVGYLNVR